MKEIKLSQNKSFDIEFDDAVNVNEIIEAGEIIENIKTRNTKETDHNYKYFFH